MGSRFEARSFAICQITAVTTKFQATSHRYFPHTTTCQLDQPVVGNAARDTVLELSPPRGTGKPISLVLDAGTSRCSRNPCKQMEFSHISPMSHMFYSKGVTNELVRMLSQSQRTSLGLPGLKPSSNSVLPRAWITRPTTDLRLGPFFSKLMCFGTHS